MNKCKTCGKDTKNASYCSRKCSAVSSNKVSPKRSKKPKFCKCGKPVYGRRVVCLDCDPTEVDWSVITIGQMRSQRKVQVNSRVRNLARQWYAIKGVCSVCGYDKHTELHHIKPISSFGPDALILEVNSNDNLLELCPNCHWEADNGLLDPLI